VRRFRAELKVEGKTATYIEVRSTSPKREETRRRRIAKAVELIRQGKPHR
jgi:uncharacterized protein YdeI (YjbR/CyaY-like superfamily)